MGIAGKNAKEEGSISTRKIPAAAAAAMGFHFLKRLPPVDKFFHSVRLPPNT
jgi:hypothetical protein